MSTELEELLREGMLRSTAGIRVPADLARRVSRRHRRRRLAAGAALAGAAAAVMAAGVTAVGLPGRGVPAPAPAPSPQLRDVAYVVRHLDSALATASQRGLVEYDRVSSLSPTGQAAGYYTTWSYRGRARARVYSASGRLQLSSWIRIAAGKVTSIVVNYQAGTWSRQVVPAPPAPPAARGCRRGPAAPGASGWPAIIRQALACGRFTLGGRAAVDGVRTIRIGAARRPGGGPGLTLWVDPATYLPVRIAMTDHGVVISRADTRWLPATPAHLAMAAAPPVPAGFTRVSAGPG